MTKKDITNKIAELRKFGYKVFTFQNNRKMRIPIAGVTDYLIIGHGKIMFVESKLISTKDKLNNDQIEFKREVEKVKSDDVLYFIINENNVDWFVDHFIKNYLS